MKIFPNMKIGSLLTIKRVQINDRACWKCVCDCGNKIVVREDSLQYKPKSKNFKKSCRACPITARQIARTKGEKFFYVGKCRKGHDCLRYVSDARCVECAKKKNKKWRDAHPVEKIPSARDIAKQQGLKVYFTGIPCVNGHITDRRTSNGECKQCGYEKYLKYISTEKGISTRKTYKRTNKGKINADTAKRRASLIQAFPMWARMGMINEKIRNMYVNCPTGFHVDHEIPLRNALVCGLHLPWNLQHLSGTENCHKNNGFQCYSERKGIRSILK